MIGKPEWFTYRIFGWGLRPRNWKGFLYIIIFLALFGLITILPISETIKMWSLGILISVIVLDTLVMMMQLSKVHDERENFQQLIIERNVSFAAVAAIVSVMLYQAYQNRALVAVDKIPFDISLLIVLGAMLLVKIVSTVYVSKKF